MTNKPANRGKRISRLSKYSREVMILEIAEMLWRRIDRTEIIKVIHQKYNYSYKTINDLLTEGSRKAAEVYPEEEKIILMRALSMFHEDVIWSTGEDSEPIPIKQKSADLLAKMLKLYAPETAIQINNFNIDAGKSLSDNVLDAIENDLRTKNGENNEN